MKNQLILGSLLALSGIATAQNWLLAGNDWAGYFKGDVFTTSSSYFTSDKRLKKNIEPLSNSLGIIAKLNPVNYSFDVDGNKDIALPSGKQYGFISQEVQEILPELTLIPCRNR